MEVTGGQAGAAGWARASRKTARAVFHAVERAGGRAGARREGLRELRGTLPVHSCHTLTGHGADHLHRTRYATTCGPVLLLPVPAEGGQRGLARLLARHTSSREPL
jgi:hypothetical protein